MIETHFWGQEGAAREYNASIWKLSDWPFEDFGGRIPKDKRASYIDAALAGTKWRLDTSRKRLALTHFDTIKVPGGTGFLAATQVFDRGLCPNQDALMQLRKQLETATAILSSTKVYSRPESIPESGTYETVTLLPPTEESGEPAIWQVSGAETEDQLLEAIRQVCRLRHSNLSVVFSSQPKGATSSGALGASKNHSLEALPQLLEQDRVAYNRELQLAKQREEEKRMAEEQAVREKEYERQQKISKKNRPKPSIRWSFLGGVVFLVMAAIGLGYYLLAPKKADVVVVYQGSDQEGSGGVDKGCADPKAMNYLDEQQGCQYQDFLVRLDNLEDGWYREELHWREHHFDGCDRLYRFSTKQAVSAEDIQELEAVFNQELGSRGFIQIRPTKDQDSLEIALRFESVPADEDRISLAVPKHFDFSFAQIQLNILHEDRDVDGDEFPASQDQFPFQKGRCDGMDENGDGVDDAIFAKYIESLQE